MNLSATFTARLVATALLTIGVALAGITAFRLLSVSPLPQVDFPTVSVNASPPGASPEAMAATVATPLERSLGRIAGTTGMTSSSSLDSSRITLQFDLSRGIDDAARDVQAAVNASRSLLPSGLPSNPTYRRVNPADAPIMIMGLTSDTKSCSELYDAASTILAQKLSQINDVGQVSIGGASLPAVRVELNPMALNKYGISMEAVCAVITSTNANKPKGMMESGECVWTTYANDQAKKTVEYQSLIIAQRKGSPVRLADMAKVTDSVQDIRSYGSANDKPSALLIISRQPGANITDTVGRIDDVLSYLRNTTPAQINLDAMMDRTPTIRASLKDVERTPVLSIALVIMVVFLFLRNVRTTPIPNAAVPVLLIGIFGVMYLCGYSLDNLSLMALTVVTGFVVDDAIVVLESVSRHIENGIRPMQTALKGAREVGLTVVSISFSLVAVFIPLLMVGGIVGRLFREFAVTLSVAVLVSLVVSLTTTSMMCARLLEPAAEEEHGRFHRKTEGFFTFLLDLYRNSLAWALRHSWLTLLILLATVYLNVYLYIIMPKGFFPQQDTGRVIGFIQADQSISFQAMRTKLTDFITIVRQDPVVENVVGFMGGSQRDTGQIFIQLEPLAERRMSADQIINRLRGKLAGEPGASLFLQSAQDIRVDGQASNTQYQYTLQANDLSELRAWDPKIKQALTQVKSLAGVDTDTQDGGLQTSFVIDRDKAKSLGINLSDIDSAPNNALGQRQVSIIHNPLNQYRVVMEAAPQYWQSPNGLRDTHVITVAGAQIPLSTFSHYEPTNTTPVVNHQRQFAANTISLNLAPGASLSGATQDVQDAMNRIGVSSSVHGSFQGTAKAFQDLLSSQPVLILLALITIYVVLGMLYESYVHPITILSTLPSAGVGALLALIITSTDFSTIALIGVILLIGIVKKNAIMMIDFALKAEWSQGMSPADTIFHACVLRFRPILMTTMAALPGALPLALGHGDGAELRTPLGISTVGGLLVSQILTLYTTPVVYLALDRLRPCRTGCSKDAPLPALDSQGS